MTDAFGLGGDHQGEVATKRRAGSVDLLGAHADHRHRIGQHRAATQLRDCPLLAGNPVAQRLVAAAGIVIAVIGYQRISTSAVTGSLVGYRLVDDETASVTISVTRSDPSRPVACIVRVRATNGSETGRRELLVPPSEATTVQVTTTVKSSQPPVMADVYGCGTEVPSYLRLP